MVARRAPARRRGPKVPVSWTRRLFNNVQVDDTPVIVTDIVTPGNWVLGNMNERATVKRIVGHLVATATTTGASREAMWGAIYLTDIDSAAVAPDDTAILSEDLLWMDVMQFGVQGIGEVGAREAQHWHLNIRAMRKMHSDQVLRHVMVTTIGVAITVSGFVSSLVSRV